MLIKMYVNSTQSALREEGNIPSSSLVGVGLFTSSSITKKAVVAWEKDGYDMDFDESSGVSGYECSC